MSTSMHQPHDLLHAWIDGELDPTLESQFFSLLAADSELRDRLRQMRGIRAEAQKFGAAVQPPAEVTERVFSRLGFAGPTDAAQKSRRPAAVLAALERAWAPVASAAAAAAITAILFLGARDTARDAVLPALADTRVAPAEQRAEPGVADSQIADSQIEDSQIADSQIADSQIADSQIADSRSNAAPAQVSEGDARGTVVPGAGDAALAPALPAGNNDIAAKSPVMNADPVTGDDATAADNATAADDAAANSALIARSDAVDASDAAAHSDPARSADAASLSIPLTQHDPIVEPGSAVNAMREAPQQGGPAAVDTRQYFPGLLPQSALHDLSIEIRGMNTASFPSPTIATSSDPWMANMAVAVYYSTDRSDYGLEFGQEPFAMHYSGVENGKTVRYEQNLLTPWLMATWRHRFPAWSALGGIRPYVAASLGSSLYFWPMARSGAGIMYMPDRRVRFHIGLEASLLAYPYQDSWFTSRRMGLTYGLSVLF